MRSGRECPPSPIKYLLDDSGVNDGELAHKLGVALVTVHAWKCGNAKPGKHHYKAIEEIFKKVLELGGTISGEHGIGTAKAPFLSLELQDHEIDLMKRIKRTFDPHDILNPGKIFYGSGNPYEQTDR